MTPEDIERRYSEAVVEIRDGDTTPKIRGLAVVYDSLSHDLGGFREIIKPGAFDKILAKRGLDVMALFNHRSDAVLGRTTSGTLALENTDKGLAYTIDPPATQLGRDTTELIRRRDITGSSFAFTVDKTGEQWSREKGYRLRTITDASGLYDISPVTHAAYPQTGVAVRSMAAWDAAHEEPTVPAATKPRSLAGAFAAVSATIARLANACG